MRIDKVILLFFLPLLLTPGAGAQQSTDTITTISIGVKAGLQFDLVRFMVRPASTVRIVFSNTDDMNHNLLVTKPGSRLEVVNDALALAEKGPAQDYIPVSSKVLWSIPVVPPNGSKSLTFTAPAEKGIYPYVARYRGMAL